MTLASFSACLLQNIRAATDRLCQIMLNQKLTCEFQKCCKFSGRVKAKSHKKKSHKTRPARNGLTKHPAISLGNVPFFPPTTQNFEFAIIDCKQPALCTYCIILSVFLMLVLIVEHGNCSERGVLHFGMSFCFVHVSLNP